MSGRGNSRPSGFRATLISLVCLLWVYAEAAEAEEFRLLASWSPAYVGHAEIAKRFVSQLERREDVDITFPIIGPEAIPPFEQLQPAAAGTMRFGRPQDPGIPSLPGRDLILGRNLSRTTCWRSVCGIGEARHRRHGVARGRLTTVQVV